MYFDHVYLCVGFRILSDIMLFCMNSVRFLSVVTSQSWKPSSYNQFLVPNYDELMYCILILQYSLTQQKNFEYLLYNTVL